MNIILGIGGGIAAYKACHLLRIYRENGHQVRVIPTESALKFIGVATLEALSGQPVATDVFTRIPEVEHVHLGQEADLVVIAPATADLMARIAAGRADDLITSSILMATCPIVLAPAMHTEMWNNAATQDNVATLRRRGIIVLEPAHGRLTGVDTGAGRLLDPEQIAALSYLVHERFTVKKEMMPRDLENKHILITAGGTIEAIDPVRFIGNRSSGKQGFAIAELAAQRGAKVTIIAAHTDELPTPAGARVMRVQSAVQMQELVHGCLGFGKNSVLAAEEIEAVDAVIMAAAVADYRPVSVADNKIKKVSAGQDQRTLNSLEMVENPDILAGLVQMRDRGEIASTIKIFGFAAETGDSARSALDYAKDKLRRKGADGLIFNEVGSDKVFGKDENTGFFLGAQGEEKELSRGSKMWMAQSILDEIQGRL